MGIIRVNDENDKGLSAVLEKLKSERKQPNLNTDDVIEYLLNVEKTPKPTPEPQETIQETQKPVDNPEPPKPSPLEEIFPYINRRNS